MPPRPTRRSARKYRPANKQLFVHDNGVPYKLWVHPKLADREKVAHAIQIHGGIILPEDNLAPATYAVISREMSLEDLSSVHNDPWYTTALSYDWVFDSITIERLVADRPYILWWPAAPSSTACEADELSSEPEANPRPWWLSRYFGLDPNSESFERPIFLDLCQGAQVIQPTARIRPRRKHPCSSLSSPETTPERSDYDQVSPRAETDSTSFESMTSSFVRPARVPKNEVLGEEPGTSMYPPQFSCRTFRSVWITREDGSKTRKFSPSKNDRKLYFR